MSFKVTNLFAMPSSSVILLLTAVFGFSNALPWTGPQPTNAYERDEWSPAPTFVPVSPAELFKRSSVDVNVCGWIGGNSASAATCSTGSSCIRDTIHGYVGCCATSGACTQGVYTSCVDSNSVGWSPNAGLENNGIYTCAGTAVCYRNTYPGGYFQYGCGASGDAAQIATTYTGQSSDVLLQIVYTGVNFNPTSAVQTGVTTASPSTSTASSSLVSSSLPVSTNPSSSSNPVIVKSITTTTTLSSQTIPPADTGSPTTSPAPTSQAAAPTSSKKVSTGLIAGATIAGVAVIAGLLAVLLWCCRRKRERNNAHRAGSFIPQHQIGHSPVSGPFQRISPFSPEDFPSPLRANPTLSNGPPEEQDITGVSTYGGPEMSQPSGAMERWGPVRRASQPMENAPLVSSEIDDFANGYNDAVREHDTHVYNRPEMVMGLGMGAAMGIGAPLRENDSRMSYQHPRSRDLTAEAFRSSQHARHQSHGYTPRNDGWTAQDLRGSSAEMNSRGGTVSSEGSSSNYGSASWKNSSRDGSSGGGGGGGYRDGDVSPELAIPAKSPLRQSMRTGWEQEREMNREWARLSIPMGNTTTISAATPMVANSPIDERKKRYQLVDEVVGEDVPILKRPGHLKGSRVGRRGR